MATKIMPISDLRRQTSQVIQGIQEEGDVVYVTQHGRPTVVVLDYEYYETLMAQLEDLADLASLEAAADEPERDYDAFLAEMGLSSNG
ncbi:MAG: type II toxin-antitoxin system Phd/YefM family antitoxin [Ardenticatenaceae bacterium]|nr:type II toxin-antitoxin system Phd/YefM family antitoxin [Ardenticatenaceae bacterium]